MAKKNKARRLFGAALAAFRRARRAVKRATRKRRRKPAAPRTSTRTHPRSFIMARKKRRRPVPSNFITSRRGKRRGRARRRGSSASGGFGGFGALTFKNAFSTRNLIPAAAAAASLVALTKVASVIPVLKDQTGWMRIAGKAVLAVPVALMFGKFGGARVGLAALLAMWAGTFTETWNLVQGGRPLAGFGSGVEDEGNSIYALPPGTEILDQRGNPIPLDAVA